MPGARGSTRHIETLLTANSLSGTVTRSLANLPTPGNSLIARCFAGMNAGSITCPGFQVLDELTLAGTLTVLRRVVQAGDGLTYSFTGDTAKGKAFIVVLDEYTGIVGTVDIQGDQATAGHVTTISANAGHTAADGELVLTALGTIP